MKKILPLAFAIISMHVHAQFINQVTLLDSFSLQQVDSIFAANIGENINVGQTYPVKTYRVLYNTVSWDSTPTVASGLLCVPVGAPCATAIVSYQHGTTTQKNQVASYEAGGEWFISLMVASFGFVSVQPDYLGLGYSTIPLHPYQHAHTEATAVIDMIRAAKDTAAGLGAPVDDQLFLMGYSQGGHSTMAAHQLIQEQLDNTMHVTASAPMSGAYDMGGVMSDLLTADQPYPAPYYLPYLVLAYQEVYNLFPNDSDAFIHPYDVTMPGYFYAPGGADGGTVDANMPSIPEKIMQPALVDSFIIDSTTNYLRDTLRANDTYNWTPNSPVHMYGCGADQYVPFQNAKVAYQHFIQNGTDPSLIDTIDVNPTLNHQPCAQYAIIAGALWFKSLAYQPLTSQGVTVENDSSNTDSTNPTGSATESDTLGNPPYSYLWSNGATTATISNLFAGTYYVTVTDRSLCTLIDSAVIRYVNDSAPIITKFAPIKGAVGTLVTVTGTDLSNLSSFTIGGVEAIVVAHTAKTVVGMVMPGATTGVVSVTGHGVTVNSNTQFTVTETLYPSIQEGNKLTDGTDTSEGFQGSSVAISANGKTAIVGGAYDDNATGAAWIYERTGTSWAQVGSKIIGTGAVGAAAQGGSVAISAQGTTAIVGGNNDNGGVGAFWVFTKVKGVWKQQGNKLVASDYSGNSYQGEAVSISADGNTALIGGGGDNNGDGAAWIFTRTGNTWTQQGNKLVGAGTAGGGGAQGSSVALSADGNTAIVGSSNDSSQVGAAFIYVRSGNVWNQQGSKLVGSGGNNNTNEGSSVALSADGNTAIVGGYGLGSDTGGAWIFTRQNAAWTQQGNVLVGTGNLGTSGQGSSVSLSADGNTAAVGGNGDDAYTGATWIFTRTNGTWTQRGKKLVGTEAVGTAIQGYSVSLSATGNQLVVGGPYDNSFAGAAWVFKSTAKDLVPPSSGDADYKDYTITETAPTNITAPFNVLAYPNPYTGSFHLAISGAGEEVINIKIYDIYGQQVFATNMAGATNLSPELGSNLSGGVYLIQVLQGSNSKTLRMVKAE